MNEITSPHNPQLKHLAKLLAQAKARREHGQTVLEGIHLLQSYLDAGGCPEHVYLPEKQWARPEIQALLPQVPPERLTLVSDHALAKITSLTEAEEVMTLIAMPSEKPLPQTADCVVLDRVQDPGNVGTVLRSAAAAGVRDIVLSGDCADVWSPKVLRAAMGAHFLLELHTRADLPQWLQAYQGRVWATALSQQNQALLYDLDLHPPAAWVFGNEGSGVSAPVLAAADAAVLIPMAGQTESLNVAMAATVCLFEQMRQRMNIHSNQ